MLIEGATDRIGRPQTVYVICAFIVVWVVVNVALGVRAFDPNPFEVLQGILAAYAAVVTTIVLASQSVQRRLDARRDHIELQVNLLSEQKVSKIISMLEELRADSPSIANKRDAEAEQLAEAVDPEQLHQALKRDE